MPGKTLPEAESEGEEEEKKEKKRSWKGVLRSYPTYADQHQLLSSPLFLHKASSHWLAQAL